MSFLSSGCGRNTARGTGRGQRVVRGHRGSAPSRRPRRGPSTQKPELHSSCQHPDSNRGPRHQLLTACTREGVPRAPEQVQPGGTWPSAVLSTECALFQTHPCWGSLSLRCHPEQIILTADYPLDLPRPVWSPAGGVTAAGQHSWGTGEPRRDPRALNCVTVYTNRRCGYREDPSF